MVGYEAERAQLVALLDSARTGAGGALVIGGEPGAGKSTLCQDVVAAAEGMTVLTTRGVPPESTIAYAGLYDVVSPLQVHLEALPDPQARALARALALEVGEGADALGISIAVSSLLEIVSPAVVVIDDAMWLDPSSQAVLGFAARRARGKGIAVVVTERVDERADGFAGLPRVELAGLDRGAAGLLLETLGGPVDQTAGDDLWAATGGNPLALIETARRLPAGALRGTTRLPDVLPTAGTVTALYAAQIAEMPDETRRALALLAAGDLRDRISLEKVLAAAELRIDDVAPALHARLLLVDGDAVTFRHPLVRSAAYYGMPDGARRRAHVTIADVVADPDRRAWHLAAAAHGRDDDVARLLWDVAERAVARGAHAEAAEALERAAELADDRASRVAWLIAAARSAHVAGRSVRALELLDAVLAEAVEPAEQAAVADARAEIDVWRGRPRAARDVLVEVADQVEADAPMWAARLRSGAVMPSTMFGDVITAHELAGRAWEVLEHGDQFLAATSACAVSLSSTLVGDRDRGIEVLDGSNVDALAIETLSLPLAFMGIQCRVVAGEIATAVALAERFIDAARRSSAPGLIVAPLSLLADAYFRQGRLHHAYAAANEAVELAIEFDHSTQLGHALVMLARVEAVWGRGDPLARAAEIIDVSRRTGAEALVAYACHATGLAHLSAARFDAAVADLVEARRLVLGYGVEDPFVVPWGPDLVEACVLAGRTAQAVEVVEDVELRAARTRTPWSLGTAARCRGMLGASAAEEAFAEARRLLPPEESPWEAARTELALGRLLRRTRQRRAARHHLGAALEAFERLEARPWVQQAVRELRAAGGRPGTTTAPATAALTPQELSIALQVATGATNREVATALYLSPKTVENRLTRIYAKLGVRSRTELAARLNALT